MFVAKELYQAIGKDKRAEVREALAKGLDPDGCFRSGTLLTEAASKGRLAIVRMLLAAGANPDFGCGCSALYLAVQNRHVPVAIALIEEGNATVDFGEIEHGCTPLYEALRSYSTLQSIELVRMLIDRGADLDRKNFHDTSPRDLMHHNVADAELRALVDAIPIKTEHAPVVPRPSPPHPSARRFPPDFLTVYNELVPRSGPAATRIGELLRAIERLRNEALGNANINWGPMFEDMVAYICRQLADRECDADLAELRSSTTRRLASEAIFDRLLARIMDEWRAHGDAPR